MVAASLAFVLFFLLPFQFSLGAIGEHDMAIIRLIVPGLVLGWVMGSLLKRKMYLPQPLTLFFFSAFLIWMILSLSWAEQPQWALRKILFWLTFFPLFLLFTSVFQKKSIREGAIKGMVWGAATIASIGIAQFFAQFFIPLNQLIEEVFRALYFFLGSNFASAVAVYPSILVNIGGHTFMRASGFFPDPHIFAYYTAMMFPLACYRSLKSHTFIEKALPVILLGATLLSFSRASYVALLVIFGIFGLITLNRYRSRLSVPLILIGLAIVVLIGVSPAATRFQSSFSATDGSVSERTRLWHEAGVNIQERPFLGVGLGNYPLLVKPSAEPREPIYVHNLYLDLAVELGLIGLVTFLLFVISCIPKNFLTGNEFLSYRTSLLLSLGIFLTHSLFEYPLFSVHILTLFLALLALLYVEKIRA